MRLAQRTTRIVCPPKEMKAETYSEINEHNSSIEISGTGTPGPFPFEAAGILLFTSGILFNSTISLQFRAAPAMGINGC
jgi:hypothetical protein